MLRDRLFRLLTRVTSPAGRRWIYLGAAALTVLALSRVPRLEIQTSRQGMISDELPVQADINAYMEDFGSPTQLILVLEGDEERIKAAADAVAAALALETDWVRNVFHRVDVAAFRASALYYLPLDRLRSARDFLARSDRRSVLLVDRDLAAVLAELVQSSAGASEEILSHPGLAVARSLLAEWREALEGAESVDLGLEEKLGSLARELLDRGSAMDPEGYLLSDDGRLAFLFVQPRDATDEASYVVPLIERVREVARRTLDDLGGEDPGVAFGLTGWPAAIAEDYGLLVTDLPRVSLLATALILAIFLAAFRSLHRMVLVFVPLVCGLVWALGLTELLIGHLNYLSSVFVGVLFGLGIDFGIYFIRRFDEERMTDPDPVGAVRRTLKTAGQGVLTGGLTAVVAFLAIALTDQPAFSELGLVAALGVGCVLLATIFLLPSLLVHKPPGLAGIRKEVGSPWLERSAAALLRHRTLLLAAALLLALGLAIELPKLGFDYDLNNLLPAEAESVRVLRDMEKRSPYSDQFIVVVADDMAQVRALHQSIESLPTVRRVESLATVLPEDVPRKTPLVREIANLIPAPGPPSAAAGDLARLETSVRSLVETLREGEEDAFASGQAQMALEIADLLAAMERISQLLAAPEAAERQRRFESELFAARDRFAAELRVMARSRPIGLESLEASVRERFVGRSGRLAVLAFPARPIWDLDFLRRFVGEVRGAAGSVLGPAGLDRRMTGFAVVYNVTAPAIRDGFARATWTAALVVSLMLLVDLRRPLPALLALTPLVATSLVLLGGMAALGVELTMATQVAFPILFGLGVAYGVHMVHRLAEPGCPTPARAVGTTGKAIGLAAATTMAGFASMTVARHTGLVDFGTMLLLGILVSVLAALYLLPALAGLLRVDRRPRSR